MVNEGVKLNVDEKGNIKTEFFGYSGNVCFEVVARIQKRMAELGVSTSYDVDALKPEAMQAQANEQRSARKEVQ